MEAPLIWGKVGELENCITKIDMSMNYCKICLFTRHIKLEPLHSTSERKRYF